MPIGVHSLNKTFCSIPVILSLSSYIKFDISFKTISFLRQIYSPLYEFPSLTLFARKASWAGVSIIYGSVLVPCPPANPMSISPLYLGILHTLQTSLT